jgi:hypothetical protein
VRSGISSPEHRRVGAWARRFAPGGSTVRAPDLKIRAADAFAQAEAVLLARFREVSLADIAADVKRNDRRRKR